MGRGNLDATELRRINAVALREAFLWEEQRGVDRYDPFDLGQIQDWFDERRYPDPTPGELHRKRRREVKRLTMPLSPATGLNLLALARKQHEERVQQELGQTHFSRLMNGKGKPHA